MNTEKISPLAMPSYGRNEANAIFMAGDAAFTVIDSTMYGVFNDPAKSKIAGKVSMAPQPMGPRRKRTFAWNDIWGWAIPKAISAERKALAKQALNAMLNDSEGQIRMWKETGGSGVLETLGARAVLTSHMAATLAGHGTRNLLLGFRPEHVLLSQPPGQGTLKIAGTVRVTEQIGTEQIIDVRVAGVTLRVTRVDADRQISVGETIALAVPAERLHFFAAETGMAISRS